MIDSRTLHDFLTANVHPELYPRLFVISHKGKLVAHSTKHDITRIEDEAALAAKVWRETAQTQQDQQQQQQPPTSSSKTNDPPAASASRTSKAPIPATPTLTALTVEAEKHNILIKPVQSNLLLVLVGTAAPGTSAKRVFKITPETTTTQQPYPSGNDEELEKQVVALTAGSKDAKKPGITVLRLQRRKIDVLAEAIMAEAEVVKIPDDS